MKPEELEDIDGELVRALDLDDQKCVAGQASKSQNHQGTFTPAGVEMVTGYVYTYS